MKRDPSRELWIARAEQRAHVLTAQKMIHFAGWAVMEAWSVSIGLGIAADPEITRRLSEIQERLARDVAMLTPPFIPGEGWDP